MATFSIAPDFGAQGTTKPRVLKASFGDGYEQRIGDGINTQTRTWSLTFNNRTDAEASSITSFLIARGGVESFDWTPPSGAAGKWVCDEWTQTPVHNNINSVTATFREVFEL